MDKEIQKAYDTLVPADQLVIDAMIVSLFKKDKTIRDLVQEFKQHMDAHVLLTQSGDSK